jgi:hypothetical protein
MFMSVALMMIMMTVTVMKWWMNGIRYMIPMTHSAPKGVSLEPCYIPAHPKNSFMKIKVTFIQHSVMCCHLCCITS